MKDQTIYQMKQLSYEIESLAKKTESIYGRNSSNGILIRGAHLLLKMCLKRNNEV